MPSTNWTIRVFKSWVAADLTRAWVNNYELVSDVSRGPEEMVSVVNTIVAAEKGIHLTQVQFLQATVSTWENEPGTYDPLSFLTVPLSGAGGVTATAPSNPLDSNVCLFLRYQATTGRSGRRFYRGCLQEQDVDVGGDGRFIVAAAATWLGPTGGVITGFRTSMAPLLPGGNGIAKLALMYAKPGISSVQRAVTAINIGGIVISKRNHRYFDRKAV
jgi:hypothetical protein